MNIHTLYNAFFRHFRPHRMRMLYRAMGITSSSSVIDIGGEVEFWKMALEAGMPIPRVTILNIHPARTALLPGMTWCCGDAQAIPFADQSFDIAVSNSVIEHMGGYEAQKRFAAEARRVARKYFVQTPDVRFPIEPHFMAPFVHWFPRSIRAGMLRFTPWALFAKPTAAYRRQMVDEIRLLGRSEMQRLFPEARVISERFAGMSKSLIAQH